VDRSALLVSRYAHLWLDSNQIFGGAINGRWTPANQDPYIASLLIHLIPLWGSLSLANFLGLEYLHASEVSLVKVFETVVTFKGLQLVALVEEPLINLAPFEPRCLNSIFTDFICDGSFKVVEDSS